MDTLNSGLPFAMKGGHGSRDDHEILEWLRRRLKYLELWTELGTRPDEADDADMDLMSKPTDDLKALRERSLQVREEMNKERWNRFNPDLALDDFLDVKDSSIEGGGLGLFTSIPVEVGTILCYYQGHEHTFASIKDVNDKSYLMLVGEQLFVDPRLTLSVKARYINDPINPILHNVEFRPEVSRSRAAVVATKKLAVGDELFVSYGESYWAQAARDGFYPKIMRA